CKVTSEEARVPGLRAAQQILRCIDLVSLHAKTARLWILESQQERHRAPGNVEAPELLGADGDPCVRVGIAVVMLLAAQLSGEVTFIRQHLLRDQPGESVSLFRAARRREGPERF